MKTRTELYGREAASVLRDITMYQALSKDQILRMYPNKEAKIENLLSYLTKQNRIYQEGNMYYASPECAEHIDRSLMAAVWVLADFIDRVEFHSTGDYPAKLIFFADGEVYEVIHAALGKEALLTHALSVKSEESSRYLVLVDDPKQIEQLQLPHVNGYCTASEEGVVTYYQKQ